MAGDVVSSRILRWKNWDWSGRTRVGTRGAVESKIKSAVVFLLRLAEPGIFQRQKEF